MFKRKVKEEDVVLREFKKTTENGYEKITPTNDTWTCPVQIGFDEDETILLIPDGGFENAIVKKGFSRTYFEKRGAGYSSVAGDYLTIELPLDIEFSVKDFGENVTIKRKTGYTVKYVDTSINALDYINEDLKEDLSEDDIEYLSNVNTKSLRADLIEFLNSVPRPEGAYYLALFNLSQNYNLFEQITEDIVEEFSTDQYINADIVVTINDEEFTLNKYALSCKDKDGNSLFGVMIKYNFEKEVMNKVKELGYK